MKINQKQAKQFLENIQSKEKVAIVHHDDLDGFASGILIFDYLIKRNISPKTFVAKIGPEPFKKHSLKNSEKIIIVDLADDVIVKDLVEIKEKDILVIDHHPKNCNLPEKILEFNPAEEGYFPCSRVCYELIGGKQWLAVLGVLADKGDKYLENDSFLAKFFEKEKVKKEEFSEIVKSLICYLVSF